MFLVEHSHYTLQSVKSRRQHLGVAQVIAQRPFKSSRALPLPSDQNTLASLMIGKILAGRYEIIKLGQGNFSTTFLAVDRQLPFLCALLSTSYPGN